MTAKALHKPTALLKRLVLALGAAAVVGTSLTACFPLLAGGALAGGGSAPPATTARCC